jgi:hypothetical protein
MVENTDEIYSHEEKKEYKIYLKNASMHIKTILLVLCQFLSACCE